MYRHVVTYTNTTGPYDWESQRDFPEPPKPDAPQFPTVTWRDEYLEGHHCPLTDPANANKPMLYYCPICNGVNC